MHELPTGTVTFLFTDVEGSTRLWEQHPEAMRRALGRHDELIEGCVVRHGGTVVQPRGEGDSRFAAFPRAGDAVAAANAIQHAFLAEVWPTPGPLRARIALHTGEGEWQGIHFYGTAVNRCARLRAVAQGGQTLISLATEELVRDRLPEGVELRDLGVHRLKDLQQPEHVFQLLHPDLPADFPPLKALDSRPHNLPIQMTAFIGREREVDAVRNELSRPEVRLLTLTGPGGTGKTRLSLQVAADVLDEFADGVFFVALAPINDPALVISAMAQVLDVREAGGRPLLEMLKDDLRDKQLLLVLDNFEHVTLAAPVVGELLAAAPRLNVLVTSRTVLHVYGEHDHAVPPMALPNPKHLPPLERLIQYEAVRLFIERAQAVKVDFAVTNENAPAVAEICARLDGLPLAIELAAARVRLLSPQALLARLENRLKLLTGGAQDLPARQQTLRDTIAWSNDLLDESERTLFARLAVFAGGCTLEAAEAVCNAGNDLPIDVFDGLGSLVDKSLLEQAAPAGEPRFTMLETIREYALERLAVSGEAETIRREHASFFLAFAEEADFRFTRARQGVWLEPLKAEHDNLRAALQWARESGKALTGLQLAGALHWFWYFLGYLSEGRGWLEGALSQTKALESPVARAKALWARAALPGSREITWPRAPGLRKV